MFIATETADVVVAKRLHKKLGHHRLDFPQIKRAASLIGAITEGKMHQASQSLRKVSFVLRVSYLVGQFSRDTQKEEIKTRGVYIAWLQ